MRISSPPTAMPGLRPYVRALEQLLDWACRLEPAAASASASS